MNVPARRRVLLFTLLLLAGGAGGPLLAVEDETARSRLDQIKRQAASISEQARALAIAAWPDELNDPELAAAAREDLIGFGPHGFPALHWVMSRVQQRYTGDVTAALVHARRLNLANLPPDYIPALEDAVWYGSADARRIAIPELALYNYGPSLMACIDAALEDPALLELVTRQTAGFADDRARFFLEQILADGPDELRPIAAYSLATIGGRAMMPLRDAALADNAAVRHPAIRALVPASRVDDLTVLYEYLGRFRDEEEQIVEMVRERATMLEAVLERQLDEESASPTP